MIRLNLDINRGFAGWPFYVIPKRVLGTFEERAYVVHEKVHCRQQTLITPVWWLLYALSKKFRWSQERPAWEIYIKVLIEDEELVNADYIINELVNNYWGMISYSDATTWTKSTIHKHS